MAHYEEVFVVPIGGFIEKLVELLEDSEEVIGHVVVIGHGAFLRIDFRQVEVQLFRVLFFVLFGNLPQFLLPQTRVLAFIHYFLVVNSRVDCFYYNSEPPHEHIPAILVS